MLDCVLLWELVVEVPSWWFDVGMDDDDDDSLIGNDSNYYGKAKISGFFLKKGSSS
jgi:hypothetical protein